MRTDVSLIRTGLRSRAFAWLVVAGSCFVILGGTLFPYTFSWRNRRSLTNSFGLSRDIAARGNDLLIGVDGGLGQSFRGRIDDLRIYRRALAASEIAGEAGGGAAQPDAVLWYAFDETSGDTAHDTSANRNPGRITGEPNWTAGKHGGALQFTGSREYVRVANTPAIDISGQGLTISMWLALEGPRQRFDQTILSKPWHAKSSGYPWYQYAIEFDANGSQSVDFYFGDISARPRGPYLVRPPIGRWTHIAFTYDGRTIRGYVDGLEQLRSGLRAWEPGDVFRNLLLFMPLGFGLAAVIGSFRSRRHGAVVMLAVAAVVALALSLSIEMAQSLLPHRYSSLVDVATNTIGSVAGGICYLLADRNLRK